MQIVYLAHTRCNAKGINLWVIDMLRGAGLQGMSDTDERGAAQLSPDDSDFWERVSILLRPASFRINA
eukprot:scaffold228244_cov14-Prasinocladus_malaysianus.AAC.1